MKLSYRIEDGLTVLCVDEADVYSPGSKKDCRITLSALRAEARRLSHMISRERNAEDRDTLSEYLSAAAELIDLYGSGKEFRLLPIFRDVLIIALENDKRHRKAARRILREIHSVPQHESIEFGGIYNFSVLNNG